MLPNDSPDVLTVDQALGQLDVEIENLRHKETLGGWSPWVLVASFAALVTLLVPMWESEGFASPRTACAFLSVWFVVDALFPWFTARNAWFSRAQNIPQRPGHDFKDRRPLMVLVFLRYVLIVVLQIANYDHLSKFIYGNVYKASAPWLNGIWYSFLACRVAYVFWATRSARPIADHDGRLEGVRLYHHIDMFEPSFILLGSTALLPTAYNYVSAAGLVSGQRIPASVQSGVLLAVLLYLVLWFVDLLCRAPLIDRLLYLRRDLVIRSISPREALTRMLLIVPTEKDRSGRIIVP